MDKINSIKFDGYKSFPIDKENEIPIKPYVSVLIGKNNCGKSSCIDALEMVFSPQKGRELRKLFHIISFSVTITDHDVNGYFHRGYRGHDGILGDYNEYGQRFVGKELYLDLSVSIDRDRSLVKKPKLSENQPNLELPKGKNAWTNVVSQYANIFNYYHFRRINADRDIIPEKETSEEWLDSSGNGVTNLLRKFVNFSGYDEKLVEELVLGELNKIMMPDSCFKNIRIQEIESNGEMLWEIFLEETNGKRFALSKSGSGLKTIILMLVNLYLIPHIKEYKDKKIIYAFEELENNLHPALQRRVFEYLYNYAKKNDIQIFITTHSHIAINTFFDKENTVIYHVEKEESSSKIEIVENHADKVNVLNDLEVKASDLFQSNGIIWVEGPSDRIYINRWLKEFCGSEFVEGADYQFLYYGGRLISHYTASNPEIEKDLISILTTNRNSAIIIDSDRRNKNAKINSTKVRIKKEFEEISGFCWITQGKEIENYIPTECLESKFGVSFRKKLGQYDVFPKYIEKQDKNFSNHKVAFAKSISEYITAENSKTVLDLEKQIKKLYATIEQWNK